MIKLIVSDIDDTLLVEGTDGINPEIFDVIRGLKDKGIMFAAASGRHLSSMQRLFKPVENDIIFITANGSYVSCRGYSMSEYVLDWEDVKAWVRQVRNVPDTIMTLDTREKIYIETEDPDFISLMRDGYRNTFERVDDVIAEKRDVIKLSLYHRDRIGDVAEELAPLWSDRMFVTIAGGVWLDFSHPMASKGNAVREIQKTMKISPDESMAFGDNRNDLSMFDAVTHSFAVGNAVDSVKEAARYVTDTNVNDGVLKVLKKLL